MRQLLIALSTAVLLALPVFSMQAIAETYEVKMFNKDPENKKLRNVFKPAVIKIKPGDTVKFISVDKGHNAESMKGMIPEGAQKWRSKISKDFELKLDKPGVYGYRCTPHYGLGMVGIIIVEGEGWDQNLAAAKEVKQRGKSKKVFKELFAQLDKLMN